MKETPSDNLLLLPSSFWQAVGCFCVTSKCCCTWFRVLLCWVFSPFWKYISQNTWCIVNFLELNESVRLSDEQFYTNHACFSKYQFKKMFGPKLQVVCRFGISRSSFLFDYILNVGMVHLMWWYDFVFLEMCQVRDLNSLWNRILGKKKYVRYCKGNLANLVKSWVKRFTCINLYSTE